MFAPQCIFEDVKAGRCQIDVVLLDLSMPEVMGGFYKNVSVSMHLQNHHPSHPISMIA